MKRRIRVCPAYPAVLSGLALMAAACDKVPSESTGPVPPASLQSHTASAEKAVLIGFVTPPGEAEVVLVERYGGRVTNQYKYIPVFAATIPADQEDALEAEASVAYVEDDLEVRTFAGKQITDWGVRKIEAPGAWELGSRGSGVRVGIFDTGIDVDHPDLSVAGGVDLLQDGFGIETAMVTAHTSPGSSARWTTGTTRWAWRPGWSSTRCACSTVPGAAPSAT